MTFQELLPYIAPIIVIDLILVVVALIDLSRREPQRVRGPKWAWVLVSLFISTLGPIAYFVFGRRD